MKWGSRKAWELKATSEFWSFRPVIYFRLDAEDGKVASVMSTLRPLDQVSELSREELRGDGPDVPEIPGPELESSVLVCTLAQGWSGKPPHLSQHTIVGGPTKPADTGPRLTTLQGGEVVNEPPKLLKANFKACQVVIAVSSLPNSFRDAIQVVRHLGVSWLWIDSLCIIQDSEDDWRYQSFLMDKRVLAARTLHFTRTEVFWECIENLASESVPDSLSYAAGPDYALIKPALVVLRKAPRREPLDSKLDEDIRVGWQQLTHSYVKCLLMKETDRLIAISGISKLIEKATGTNGERLAGTRPLNTPTWSWAPVTRYSYISESNSPQPGRPRPAPLAGFASFGADPYTGDETGQLRSAFLHLRGRLFSRVRGGSSRTS
ncbi:hypothetical protein DL770_002707 [Monosporascus sp. CRB-9-2]|nr:hypothetical protein DL770_002707 [Monosporascus sp. CRB-9-2]